MIGVLRDIDCGAEGYLQSAPLKTAISKITKVLAATA